MDYVRALITHQIDTCVKITSLQSTTKGNEKMSKFIVSYDLHKAGQNYTCIINKLKSYGSYWHIQGSVWIIATQENATQIRDKLKACLDSNDKLFVAKLSGEAAWKGYPDNVSQWIKEHA
jgi:hypothetical protein